MTVRLQRKLFRLTVLQSAEAVARRDVGLEEMGNLAALGSPQLQWTLLISLLNENGMLFSWIISFKDASDVPDSS